MAVELLLGLAQDGVENGLLDALNVKVLRVPCRSVGGGVSTTAVRLLLWQSLPALGSRRVV